MKTKFFKFVIPAFAIVLAVAVSAFTVSDGSETDANTMITGYYPTGIPSEPCDNKLVDCNLNGSKVCTIDEVTYFRILDGTSCKLPLRKND